MQNQVRIPPVEVNNVNLDEAAYLLSVNRDPMDYCSVSVPARVIATALARDGSNIALVMQVQPALTDDLIKLPKVLLNDAGVVLDIADTVTVNVMVAKATLTTLAANALAEKEAAMNAFRDAAKAVDGGAQ
jgi:hypothetical protein